MSVVFPHNQLQILPYNRVLKDLNGLGSAQLLKKLELIFTILPKHNRQNQAKNMISLFFWTGRGAV